MPLVSGYHLHTPRTAHPNRLLWGKAWKAASSFLFLLVLGDISLLLALTGMYRFPLLDQHTAIKNSVTHGWERNNKLNVIWDSRSELSLVHHPLLVGDRSGGLAKGNGNAEGAFPGAENQGF